MIYISGKITNLDLGVAFRNFEKSEEYLREQGYDNIVNPMKLHDLSVAGTWEDYMAKDIRFLLDCDSIFLQKDWILSRGARIEYQIAKELGLKILFEEEVPF